MSWGRVLLALFALAESKLQAGKGFQEVERWTVRRQASSQDHQQDQDETSPQANGVDSALFEAPGWRNDAFRTRHRPMESREKTELHLNTAVRGRVHMLVMCHKPQGGICAVDVGCVRHVACIAHVDGNVFVA